MRHKFFAAPSFGGKLTILNVVSWGILAVSLRVFAATGIHPILRDAISGLAIALAFVLSFPIALPFMLPSTSGPSLQSAIISGIAIGVNAFVWGYGLAYLSRSRRSKRGSR